MTTAASVNSERYACESDASESCITTGSAESCFVRGSSIEEEDEDEEEEDDDEDEDEDEDCSSTDAKLKVTGTDFIIPEICRRSS